MNKHILLGVTGSIAAYKAAELVRLMQKKAWDVSVVMTKAATEFVSELTFRTLSKNSVGIKMFGKHESWYPKHISLADKADVMVIAPCTANVIAKLAHGIADDLLTCTALALNTELIVAPAMNERMWNHPATRANVETLKSRGIHIVDVGKGELASGDKGYGHIAEPAIIISEVESVLNK